MIRNLDISFIKRVYKTSIGVWVLALLLCWGMKNLPAAIGVTVGLAISLGSLIVLERLVTTLFSTDNSVRGRRPGIWLLVVAYIKYLIIGIILWAVVTFHVADPRGISIAIGIGIPFVVIMLKALGMVLTFGPELNRRL